MKEKIDPLKFADLKSIGNAFKNKREENSYTLEHVSEITRITLGSIKNIEEGNFEALPGLVFVRGFIRNYSKLLGLESDWMIEALNQAYQNNEEKGSHDNVEIKKDPLRKNDNKLSFIFVGVALVIIIGVLIFSYLKTDMIKLTENKKIDMIQAVVSDDAPEKNTSLEQNKTQTIDSNLEQQKKVLESIISPMNLILLASKNEWIRLSIDSKPPIDLLLTKGEKYEWPGDRVYDLIMTTGSSAKIHLNGEEIDVDKQFKNQLFQIKLNKFSLTRINN